MNSIKNILGVINPTKARLFLIFVLTLFVTFSDFTIPNAYAAEAQCTINNATQLDADEFKIVTGRLVRDIIAKVTSKLMLMSEQMFSKIILSPDFAAAVMTAITLFIIIYAILFVTGMAQIKLYDFVMMLIKIGVIFMLWSPTAWKFFSDNVVRFFNNGTVELINYFTKSGNPPTGTPQAVIDFAAGSTAFLAVDSALSKIISSKMFVILMAAFTSENYGFIMGALMVIAILLFLKSLLTALWVYVMSLIMKTLLFGLAPIFLPTILFKRTRHLFDNWLNQIVSASLQPILLFIFFVFFVKLLESAVDNIAAYPVCWTQLPNGWRGSPIEWFFWRFAEYKGGTTGWIPNPNELSTFPIPIIHILTFLILAELANRFNTVVVQIAMQIAQASTNLSHGLEGAIQSITQATRRTKGLID